MSAKKPNVDEAISPNANDDFDDDDVGEINDEENLNSPLKPN